MGAGLFERFPDHCAAADAILGYSLRELCLDDPGDRLRQTQHAQPALFAVNALAYLDRIEGGRRPDFLAGHSLGEYSALFAAGCFDFETGLRLVVKRAELMGAANGGAMVAVVGLPAERVTEILGENGATGVNIANYNTPDQVVLSGPRDALSHLAARISAERPARCVPLAVSAAFHSRHMDAAAEEFCGHLRELRFQPPGTPVIANVTGRPYPPEAVATLLGQQIRSPVRWWDSMRYLREQAVEEVEELGPGRVLTGLWRSAVTALPGPNGRHPNPPPANPSPPSPERNGHGEIAPERLGCAEFLRDYGIRYAYLAGSMYQGIASTALVTRLARAGLMGFFGTGGLRLAEVEDAILTLRRELGPRASWGMNLLYALDDPALEAATVELFLRHDVRFVEAAAYLQMTPALVRFRFQGAHVSSSGEPLAVRRVLAKVSRPEIASLFMSPPPEGILRRLVEERKLTEAEAEVARRLPVAAEVCVEADSGGHTDAGRAYTLMPAMLDLRDQVMARHAYPTRIRIGAAGGLGSPEAVAAAFVLGADFVVTGSVNQCSPEAGTSEAVKDLLSRLDVQDTAYTPAGDMFELGARVQVVSKGTLFAARANKLYEVYRRHGSLEELDEPTRRRIEERYFKRSFAEVWQETEGYLSGARPAEVEKARRDPKHRMALLFNWYFVHSTRLALEGGPEKVNYQIHCGPAMGAFNRAVRGTELEDWRQRHVDLIAERLMRGAAALLSRRFRDLASA